jgi:hypothetical protein
VREVRTDVGKVMCCISCTADMRLTCFKLTWWNGRCWSAAAAAVEEVAVFLSGTMSVQIYETQSHQSLSIHKARKQPFLLFRPSSISFLNSSLLCHTPSIGIIE